MRTFEQIYTDLNTKTGEQYTIRELIGIFEHERSWIGSGLQLMRLREISHEITGIRVGNCSGCLVDMMTNMARWVNRYESEHTQTETNEVKKGRPFSK